ncbi:MAG: hypothetical protein HZA24_08065 [Nitrospirae bacterium]|nr:hypothetical protein [Nitrospirota bacterium]
MTDATAPKKPTAGAASLRGPLYRLVVAGAAVMAAGFLMTAVSGWYGIRQADAVFDRLDTAWSHADGVMEINMGSLKGNWAMDLAMVGDSFASQRVLREASADVRAQVARVQEAGLVDPVEIASLREQYDQLQDMMGVYLKAGAEQAGAEERARLVAAQQSLDVALADLEKRADALMEARSREGRDTVHGLVLRNATLGAAGLLLWMLLAAFVVRRVMSGLSRPITRISDSTVQLTEAAQYQVKSAMEQASAAIQISTTMQELLASYKNLTERSRDMVQTSKAAADECRKGHAFLSKSQQGIGQIKVEVERITEHMRSLEEKTHQINSVLEIINEMASQTNLLSINATIEAAGAGEAGRRFAVVAEEIRLLAERAVESTEEIRTLIEDIQETARVTNAVTLEGEQAVDRGLEDAARVAENFNALLTLVTQTVDAVQTIEATAREQGNAVVQVSEAVESLTTISSETERHSTNTLSTVESLAWTASELQGLAGVSNGKG